MNKFKLYNDVDHDEYMAIAAKSYNKSSRDFDEWQAWFLPYIADAERHCPGKTVVAIKQYVKDSFKVNDVIDGALDQVGFVITTTADDAHDMGINDI